MNPPFDAQQFLDVISAYNAGVSPMPAALFATFGLLLWAARPVPVRVLVIPFGWSLVGGSAALQFGIPEDYGLLVAGLAGTALVLMKNRRLARAGDPEAVPA